MLWLIVILHYFADMATSIFQPLGPYITAKFSISPRIFAMTLYSITLTSSMLQPFFGMITDKISRRNIYLSLVVSMTMLSAYMISLAASFIVFLILAFIAQLSNSAFHPMGASIAGYRRKGHHIAIFSLAGMFGYATGPVFITWYAQNYNLKGLHILGIVLAALALMLIPRMRFLITERRKKSEKRPGVFRDIFPIMMYIAFRSFAMGLAQVYGPMYVKQLGGTLVAGGSLLTFTRFAGMGLSFLGVYLREKTSNNFVNLISAISMALFGLAFTFSQSLNFVRILFIAMLAPAYLSMSSNVVEAQNRAPDNPGLASSLAMGLAWSLGSLMNLVYSSIFGNNIGFMMNSFWVISCLSMIFVILDILRTHR